MITYFDGLQPNPNFEMDPNRTLLEQIEELPYDLHWEFPRNDVRFGSVLGEGNFGRVWLAKAKGIKAFNPRDRSDLSSRAKLAKLQDQRVHEYFTTVTEAWVLGDCDTTHHYDVAVKTLKESATPKHKIDLASELKLLIYMGQHPNIVNVLAACTIRGDLWMVLEYCDHGCLKTFLSNRRKEFIPTWSKDTATTFSNLCLFDLLRICEQISNGLMFIHYWNVVHRDLSARNILVDINFNVKIADFGLARSDNFVASDDDLMPIKWSSLESLLRHEYSTKSDIWSMGVLFWEIFSLGEVPYPDMNSREVIQQLKEGYRMSPPDHCPPEIWSIISDCWNVDPDLRPSAMQMFEQLDEVKVAVCTATDGEYYGTGGKYEEAGTIQGPSLEEILHHNLDTTAEDKGAIGEDGEAGNVQGPSLEETLHHILDTIAEEEGNNIPIVANKRKTVHPTEINLLKSGSGMSKFDEQHQCQIEKVECYNIRLAIQRMIEEADNKSEVINEIKSALDDQLRNEIKFTTNDQRLIQDDERLKAINDINTSGETIGFKNINKDSSLNGLGQKETSF